MAAGDACVEARGSTPPVLLSAIPSSGGSSRRHRQAASNSGRGKWLIEANDHVTCVMEESELSEPLGSEEEQKI